MWTLFLRECKRIIVNWRTTILPPLVTNILYIIVFGSILGDRVREIQGFTYIQFILPGIITLGAIMNAFENSSFSIFHARWDEYIEEVITSPMSYWEMLAGYVSAATLRGVFAGLGIMIVSVLFTELVVKHIFIFSFFLVFSNILFSSLGIIVGLWADDFGDVGSVNTFFLTPLVFLGGVFYSLQMLPSLWYNVSLLNPLVYMVNGIRYGMVGQSDIPVLISALVLFVMTVFTFGITVYLFNKGYGLQE